MEVPPMENSSASGKVSGSASRLLRYPLRSANKPKEEKQPLGDSSNTSATAKSRGRIGSSVSKSVGFLDVSGNSSKEKSAKPPRRLSIPSKASVTPAPKSLGSGSTTPVSEASSRKSRIGLPRSGTPRPEVSKPSSLVRKFNSLNSASYWLSLIKLSESAAKHSVSLGFFKLALEFGCEPLQLLRDELKSYFKRHNLAEFGDTVKELCENYNISENVEQLQVSETCSHVPEEETKTSEDDVHSSSSFGGVSQKSKVSSKAEQTKDVNKDKETTKKNGPATTRVSRSVTKKATDAKSSVEPAAKKAQSKPSKPQKPIKQEPKNQKEKKQQAKESADAKGPLDSPAVEKELQENKENVDAVQTEEMSVANDA